MKKIFVVFAMGFILVSNSMAKERKKEVVLSNKILKKSKGVAWCSSYLIGVNIDMKCRGDINGETTPYKLLHARWKIATSISGASKFILVFTK